MSERRIRYILGACLCAAGLSGAPGHAAADDSGVALKAQARALFEEAKKLVAASKYPEACPKFQESQRLDPGIGTKFYLADCLEHVNRYASAWVLYLEVSEEAGDANMKERAEYAKKRADALQPKLTRMKVVLADDVKSIPGIEVRRDGVVLQAGQWDSALPVDGGKHTIEVGAPGKRTWQTTVEASGEGATVTVTIPALKDDIQVVTQPAGSGSASAGPAASGAPTAGASAGPSAAPTAVPSGSAGPETPPESGMGAQRILGLAAAGLGVVAVGVGAGFGAVTLSKVGDAKAHCSGASPDVCDAQGVALMNDAKTTSSVADVGLIAGGVLVAAGVVLFVTGGPAKPKTTGVRLQLTPVASPTSAGGFLRGQW